MGVKINVKQKNNLILNFTYENSFMYDLVDIAQIIETKLKQENIKYGKITGFYTIEGELYWDMDITNLDACVKSPSGIIGEMDITLSEKGEDKILNITDVMNWELLKNPSFPKKISEYEILKNISSGGFGTIYLAKFKDSKYAIKKQIFNKESYERVYYESKLVKNISSYESLEGFVKIYDVLYEEYDKTEENMHVVYFVMQYVEGKTLNELSEKEINHVGIMNICKSLLLNLSLFHSAGFVHSDIKPENIILEKSGNVKYVDFSLSCNKEEKEDYTIKCLRKISGTKHYIAPEILYGKISNCENINICSIMRQKSDVYSLGITLANFVFDDPEEYITNKKSKLAYDTSEYKKISLLIGGMLKTNYEERLSSSVAYGLLLYGN